MHTIGASINKTNRVMVVHEDNLTNGPGSEISAIIADNFFEKLDAVLTNGVNLRSLELVLNFLKSRIK